MTLGWSNRKDDVSEIRKITIHRVTAKHKRGQGRWHKCRALMAKSTCPGVELAALLNNLGDDNAPFITDATMTNLDARRNWVNAKNGHVVWEE